MSASARDFFALERNVNTAAGAFLILGLGEELWKKFLPKYLEALGAGPVAIGIFGSAEDLGDALYQYPGGALADRLGPRRAFILFIALAALGYLAYLLSPSWPWVFLGLALATAWHSMGSPATFAVIAEALPPGRRAMGFTVQSILKRIPMLVSPLIGGTLIAALGVMAGIRVGLAVTLAFAIATLPLILTMNLPVAPHRPSSPWAVWVTLPPALRRLLVSDIVIRTCEGMAGVFVILYVTTVRGTSVRAFGFLIALQVATSIAAYLPAARLSDRIGRKPLVAATFLAFAAFPVCVAVARGPVALALAFVMGGLREIGEPSRKAMIVDAALPGVRARTVGLYYLVRSLSVAPAAALGGLLWRVSPATPFYVAGAIGLVGTLVFLATVEEKDAA
ncbi:MAG: MFS transporter [Gemmatimonadota bacterium]